MKRFLQRTLSACISLPLLLSLSLALAPAATAQSSGGTILRPSELETLLPKTVFFRGQSAPVQLRNAGGVKFSDGMFFFSVLVDTSGYSTGVQAKYQAYFTTEVPLQIGSQHLAPGSYGVGFLKGNKFLVMDVGAHDLFTAETTHDAALKRPTPLQVIADTQPDHYRLYEGRDYVTFSRAAQ